jgi:hypothetical protein
MDVIASESEAISSFDEIASTDEHRLAMTYTIFSTFDISRDAA